MEKKKSQLESNFELALNEANDLIETYLADAAIALNEAIKVSEQYGVPFYANVSFLSQQYTPESYQEKWSELSSDFMEDMEIYADEYAGWQHSAVC